MDGVSIKKNDDYKFVNVGAGLCYQIAAVVDGLSCGLVGKIVAQLGENCKRHWCDGFDWAGVGCGLV